MASISILLPSFTFHFFFFFLLLLANFTSYTFSLCNHHDSSALLQFKNSFFVNTSSKPELKDDMPSCSSFSFKTETWNNSTDCCKWDGVTCGTVSDYVIGLDLSCNNLEGELHPNSTIFQLRHLQQLNLAFNDIYSSSVHVIVSIGDLVNLTHLNLSYCYLTGNIPSTISHLSKLVSLDLRSDMDYNRGLKLNPLTWKKLIHNATNLSELYLDRVDMSAIRGSSLSMLKNFSSSLVSLSLSYTRLQGHLSSDILSSPNLQKLDLSYNDNLSGQLPKSNWSSPLRYLDLSSTAFSGEIPYSIGQLKSLTHLVLHNCNFDGRVPQSLGKLTQLITLDFSDNNFKGEIPNVFGNLVKLKVLLLFSNSLTGHIPSSISNLTQLTRLNLRNNNISGNIPNVFGNLIKLEHLSLYSNSLTGQIPSSFFQLPQVSTLDLYDNSLVGPIPKEITKHSKLSKVYLSDNMLNGTIPHWCYYLPSLSRLDLSNNHLTGFIGEFLNYSLQYLDLSNNNLNGHLQNLKFKELYFLNLSHNNFISFNIDSSVESISPHLQRLDLSSNKIKSFPKFLAPLPDLQVLDLSSNKIKSFPKFLAPLPDLQVLDLSNNNIHGKIPIWFHRLLNSSENIDYIDLSSNMLQGGLPIPPNYIEYFLLSNNNFTGDISSTFCNASMLGVINLAHNKLTGTIPQCLGTLPSLSILDLQMNNFTGDISSTFCNASYMEVINLAHNKLTGIIPQCRGTHRILSVLDLQMNNLKGSMPRNFSKENQFQTIKLNGNQLEGPLPHSLVQCSYLEVLDLGDNNIEDVFPNWLGILPELQVLSLRSNKLYGTITCSSTKHPFHKLRIFDVSNNNFSGPLPTSCFKNFQGMRNVNDSQIGLQYMGRTSYYDDSVVVIMKGFSMELTRILITFTTIDLSNNMFQGEIPQIIGKLKFLKGLNLSNNGITGAIPQSLSYLRNLEWLDLSRNQLRGEIPVALTKMNFLAVLNLSQNHLERMIPKGQQFDTFGNDSYEGNAMLCGLPLSKSCKNDEERPPHSTSEDEEESGFGWKAVAIGYACGAISGLLLGYIVFFIGKPHWLLRLVEQMFNMRLKRINNRAGANRRRMN